MKIIMKSTVLLLALGMSALVTSAQDADSPPPGEGPMGHHHPPLLVTLDANHDGVIDATELGNASAALKALDKNSDGQLTRDELMPPRPEGTNNIARAERPGRPEGMGKDGHCPPMPLLNVLDANQDGVIDATEMANASTALKTLDTNGDGQLTRDELMPRGQCPPGRGDNGSEDGTPPPDQE
jgi:hypothetical protein